MTDANEGAEAETPSLYKVTISGDGLNFDREVPQSVAFSVLSVLMGQAPASTRSTGGNGGAGSSSGGSANGAGNLGGGSGGLVDGRTVGEFVSHVNAKRNPDKIVAFGVYLQEAGKEDFTKDDIKPMFQRAGESVPANFARDFTGAVTAKWLSSNDDKTYFVTKTGREALQAGFPKEARKPVNRPARRTTKAKDSAE